MHKRMFRNSLLILLSILLVIIGGCTLTRQVPAGYTAEELTICTSFYPIYIMALNITEDVPGIKLINISAPETGCLHDVQLSPADLMQLEKSKIFIINGLGMESYLSKVLEAFPNLHLIDSSSNLDPTVLKTVTEDDGGINPHTWVSISLAIEQVKNIGEQLAETDPENREHYLKNTENYINKLEDLKTKMHQKLAGIQNKEIITFHEAFPYFAKEFNLHICATVQREPGSEPSPRELAETIQLIKDSDIRAIFVEPQYPDSTAQTIARETGAKVFTLDPAVTGPSDADAYIRTMENNLLTLQEALNG